MPSKNKVDQFIKTTDKPKIYRFLGYISAILFGAIGWISLIYQAVGFYKSNPDFSVTWKTLVLGALLTLAFNIFLWAGFILLWRADRNEKPDQPSVWLKVIKFYAVFAVLMLPLAVVFFASKPFVKKVKVEPKWVEYKLPDNFSREDAVNVINKMRENSYYDFYFHFLGHNIDEITNDVYAILNQNRSKELLYQQIQKEQEKVKSLAALFGSLAIPPRYAQNPSSYPQINKVVAEFLQEEFKLTILGTCYRSTYDKSFTFRWDDSSRLAAWKLKQALNIKK